MLVSGEDHHPGNRQQGQRGGGCQDTPDTGLAQDRLETHGFFSSGDSYGARKEWTYKVIRKIRATNELYHKALGSIDTREKFAAKRLQLASRCGWLNSVQDSPASRLLQVVWDIVVGAALAAIVT